MVQKTLMLYCGQVMNS